MQVTTIVVGVLVLTATALIAAGYVVDENSVQTPIYFHSNGNVGIGTDTPFNNLEVAGTAKLNGIVAAYDSLYIVSNNRFLNGYNTIGNAVNLIGINSEDKIQIGEPSAGIKTDVSIPWGNFSVSGTIISTTTITAANYACSDARYKHSVTPIGNALRKLMALNGVFYSWRTEKFKEMNFSKDRQLGFIAQEVEKVIPELVYTDSKGYKSMSYNKLTAVIVEAMKEMKSKSDEKISSLEKENETLKKRIASLEKVNDRVAALERMVEGKRVVLR